MPFEVPDGDDLAPRLAGVLVFVYLILKEVYVATAGPDWMRPSLCEDALRLGRVLCALAPREGEVWDRFLNQGGLYALERAEVLGFGVYGL